MVRTLSVLSILALAGSALAQPAVDLLGTLPGVTPVSDAFGVSDDGSVVTGKSGSSFYYGSSSHGYRWSRSSGMVDLDLLAPESSAWAISGDGSTIVGRESSTGSTHAYRWVGDLAETLFHGGGALAVNQDGSVIAGFTYSGHVFIPHACLVNTQHSHTQTLDDGVANSSEAHAVSADGTLIAGWADFTGTGRRAFLWNADTGMTALPLPALTSTAEALGISANGAVIVGDAIAFGGLAHAVVWNNGTPTDLASLLGTPYSIAFAVSADGSTIVGSRGASSAAPQSAWIWRADIGVQDLSTALGAQLPAGAALTAAHGLSANGRFVVGAARNASNYLEAFLADVPACIDAGFARQPADTTVNAGSVAHLSVAPAGFGPFSYQWSHDGSPIAGATAATLDVPALTKADAGTYTCSLVSACGSAQSNPATLTITGLCPADFNGDGFLDFFDYDQFVDCYETGVCPAGTSADFNADGFADFFDYDDFVTAYELGC